MPRIALCGVFDIQNFGDHLFPFVLRNELARRGFTGDICLFSPSSAKESFVNDSNVYSLNLIEKMHCDDPFDAIIVGGGEIIHCHHFGQATSYDSQSYIPYPMDSIWLIPSFMKMKYGVPLIWNAPGIPFEFPFDSETADFLLGDIDYLSVRNEFSKNVLSHVGIKTEDITIVPDTAFALRTMASAEELYPCVSSLFKGIGDYVVFHCNRFIPDKEIPTIIGILTDLHSQGFDIVLLPLAYTHGDHRILRAIFDSLPFTACIPDGPLSLKSIIGILANCSLYVGTSFHGSIVAVQYGRKIVSFDYQKTTKTKDLYKSIGLEKYYVSDTSLLSTTISDALCHQVPPDCFDSSLIQSDLDSHFDRIFHIITRNNNIPRGIHNQVNEFSSIMHQYFVSDDDKNGLLKRTNELKEALEINSNRATIFKARSDSWEHDYMQLRDSLRHKPFSTFLRVRKGS